jgi:hypothetical protein
MKTLLSILLLLTATGAEASVKTVKTDDASMIRPVSMTAMQPETGPALKRSCKPVFLFMRFPDGRIMLIGALKPTDGC